MLTDFSSITELPGKKVGRDQLEIISRRYLFAGGFAVGRRVLEVGCGPGLGLGYLASVAESVVAGDVTTSTLTRARMTYPGRYGIHLVQFDGQALPFRNASFDLILAMAMIYYLDADAFLAECRRVLTRDGIVVFCTPNKNIPGFRPSRFSTRYHSADQLMAVSAKHGFDLEVLAGFPTRRGPARLAQCAIALGGTALAVLTFAPWLQDRLRTMMRRLLRYESLLLERELTPTHLAMVENIPLIPVRADSGTAEYRILYGIARRRGGAR